MRLRLPLILLLLLAGNSCDAIRSLNLPEQDSFLLKEAMRSAAACQLGETVQVPMEYYPLYGKQGARCRAVALREIPEGESRALYSDSHCSQPVPFFQTPYGEFCQRYVRDDQLGDAADLLGAAPQWTLSPANRMPLPTQSMLGFRQPFMQRLLYREQLSHQTVLTESGQSLRVRKGTGQCVMEMRIFKRRVDEQQLMPLLLFPGGALQRKALHSLALQTRIASFTDSGFVVFLPFIRSISGGEGPEACRDASWQALTEDASAALEWVNRHAGDYGARAGTPALMAQGSGAMLATWLSVNRPSQVRRTLLLYPLVDTASLLNMIESGRYNHRSGINLLERLTGKTIDEVEAEDAAIRGTSLLSAIRQRPTGTLPPLHILHGTEDQRIPVQQSRLLCSAWRGQDALSVCGEMLFLLEGAGHQLDYCVPGFVCPAGNEQHRAMVRLVLKRARCWLKGELDENATDPERMCTGTAARPGDGT